MMALALPCHGSADFAGSLRRRTNVAERNSLASIMTVIPAKAGIHCNRISNHYRPTGLCIRGLPLRAAHA